MPENKLHIIQLASLDNDLHRINIRYLDRQSVLSEKWPVIDLAEP